VNNRVFMFYLNSGTWRTTLPFGAGGFGRLRAYSMIFCYNAAEQAAGSYRLRILGRGIGGVDRTEFILHNRIERV
jgi:hypothetical protein